MEIAPPPPLPPLDLPKFETSIGSGCSTPFLSASSSPSRLTPLFFSAPTSPSHQLSHNPSLKDANFSSLSPSHTPFLWEEKPGTPKHRGSRNRAFFSSSDENALIGDIADDEFAFDFSGNLERDAIPAAEDLFYQGIIKPLKPPPGFQTQLQGHLSESETEQGRNGDFVTACSSPKSPKRNNLFLEKIISSPKRRDYPDPFEIALENSRNSIPDSSRNFYYSGSRDLRGRGKTVNYGTRKGGSGNGKKKTRSMSPFPRVSDVLFGDDGDGSRGIGNNGEATSFWGGIFPFSKAYRKWRIKDLLFRSASEGRCTDKMADHPALTKYVEIRKQQQHRAKSNEVRNSSFRSTDSFSGSVGSSRRGKAPVSAHELHYTVNRAVYEEMKKKTYLPYKQGLLGCLGFSPPVHDISISRAGSMPRV